MPTDYRDTLFLPKTEFPMKGNLPIREPETLERWVSQDLYRKLREDAKNRDKFILHDGPPYANGDIHIGTAMNKILKDIIVRSQQMMGKDAPYVPGWDCHGLPIEWKIEEKYRKKKKNKDDVDPVEFRQECRDFAANWIDVQKEQFKRLGITGDWDHPYKTMDFKSEAAIVSELLKFAMDSSLYRGSKPVMWSPIEKTALAEAEVEYHDLTSTQIDVAFPVVRTKIDELKDASVVIWTTTPWTIPANRAICYGDDINYLLVEIDTVLEGGLLPKGKKLVVCNSLLGEFSKRSNINCKILKAKIKGKDLEGTICSHPWRGRGYDFDVPLLSGKHVTVEAGTGFVHTAPGHGDDDYKVGHVEYGIPVPHTVNESGCYYDDVPLVAGEHVYKVANHICELLIQVGALLARSELVHSYPHSWRSKAPLIYRNTSQWFISMSKTGLRDKAMKAIEEDVRWVPTQSQNRIKAMVGDRPDWIISRQRAWGVPITLFVNIKSDELLQDKAVNDRIIEAVTQDGADAWYLRDPQSFLGDDYETSDFEQVTDILDVWFDSGSTHAFVVEAREELGQKADLYLEGSDQHRGWFQSSLLESCGTRGEAPYKNVVTHGFVQDGNGRKMSKSLGNVVSPLKIMDQYGADILRLWVVATNYFDDTRIGDEIIKGQVDSYRKIRNTLRFMLGNLEGFEPSERLEVSKMPELEKYILHKLYNLGKLIEKKANDFDFNPIFKALSQFCIQDLSQFYFDIRKDSLYCDTKNSVRRRAARTVLDELFNCLTKWFAPILVFTAEEVWQSRMGEDGGSIHLQQFLNLPDEWLNTALENKWGKVREMRSAVNAAIELMRREKIVGSNLQAEVKLSVASQDYLDALEGVDAAEMFITSSAQVLLDETLDEFKAIVVVASGEKCARCWIISKEVGTHKVHKDVCLRCAGAVDC
ncbi:MAG: isoleucine--tRNA ligase [Sphingomonadales bacterium]